MVAARPVGGRGVFAGSVEGSKVDDCDFIGCVRGGGWNIDEGSGWVRRRWTDGGLTEYCGCG